LINARTVRVEPPLTIEPAQADTLFAALTDSLEAFTRNRVALSA
jgi:4-aminobutyrate aminotransferase-like enzyme